MAFSPSTVGVVYRCPLCSQRFGGRHPDVYHETTKAELENRPSERTLTAAIAKSDPRVLEHLASHSPAEWLLKIDALEREAEQLRERLEGAAETIAGEDA